MYVGLDIGGTWLKGAVYRSSSALDAADIAARVTPQTVHRVPSRLSARSDVRDFIQSLDELFASMLPDGGRISGVGVSTAGVVDYAGKRVSVAASHLGPIASVVWKEHLEKKFNAPVVLINDADAAAIGAAAKGYLRGDGVIGIMPVGTGVGFSLWRNGRSWRPGGGLPLLGSVSTPAGSFDSIAGMGKLPYTIFSDKKLARQRDRYLAGLADVVRSAGVIYRADRILIGGGLAAAVAACGYPLASRLAVPGRKPEVEVMPEGSLLSLIGAVALAAGEGAVREKVRGKEYTRIDTEMPCDPDAALHGMESEEIVELLWRGEQQAGEMLGQSLADVALAARIVARKLADGGRLIYVGAGTSGRLAALDAVELGCTFGLPRERVLTLVAGGIADAAIEMESDFEEDAGAVPDMLLTSVGERDVVVGVSASGSAWYVRSALAVARAVSAYTIFVREGSSGDDSLADLRIALRSGCEVVAGSTRMKAGTATKKVLNFISTTAMILGGNVRGPYMIGVECTNQKLVRRALSILGRLFGMDRGEAERALAANDNDLRKTIEYEKVRRDLQG